MTQNLAALYRAIFVVILSLFTLALAGCPEEGTNNPDGNVVCDTCPCNAALCAGDGGMDADTGMNMPDASDAGDAGNNMPDTGPVDCTPGAGPGDTVYDTKHTPGACYDTWGGSFLQGPWYCKLMGSSDPQIQVNIGFNGNPDTRYEDSVSINSSNSDLGGTYVFEANKNFVDYSTASSGRYTEGHYEDDYTITLKVYNGSPGARTELARYSCNM